MCVLIISVEKFCLFRFLLLPIKYILARKMELEMK